MTIQDLLKRCEDEYSNENYKTAMEICDEILKKDSKNQIALSYKADCLYHMDKHEDALEILDDAMKTYPNNYRYPYITAKVLADKRDYEKAIGFFEKTFELEIPDETALAFMKAYHETTISLYIDQLIEGEKYVDAWKWYNQLNESTASQNRRKNIESFIRNVKQYTSRRIKSMKYNVRPSSKKAMIKLIGFLNENGFEGNGESEQILEIDVVEKTYSPIPIEKAESENIISESKFYDMVNYYPQKNIVYRKIYSEDNTLLYEGYTKNNAPYGFGKAYFENGKVYREGIFDIKGIVQGREYYPSGQVRFEGQWSLTWGYGPNAPYIGNAYSEDGELIYSGKFEIKRGGVGWPMIQKPKGFHREQKNRPKIKYKNAMS